MPATKIVKIMYDGKAYWLLWHWETLAYSTSLSASERYASGPYVTLEEAEAVIPKDKDWTTEPFFKRDA